MLRSFINLILCSLALCATARSAAWSIETVDSSGAAGLYASLAVDGGGRLHLCYYDSAVGDLRYALRAGGSWIYGAIDTAGDVGRYCAIVVGADNNPRVSYFDSTNRALKFAIFDGAQWAVETADPGPGVGWYTSVCLNGTTPIVSYYDQTRGDLKLATKSGTWALVRIDSAGNVGRFSSVANSGPNQTKISYYSDTLRQLKYARQQGSNWVLELPDPAINAGHFSSLAFSGSVPIIAYLDSAGGRIKRATKPSTVWVVDTADNSGNAGGYASLALDPAGQPVISYFDLANGDLRLARRSGASWILEAVDTAGTVGLYTSCRIGADSTVYIAYFDRSLGRLKLAGTADTLPPGPPQNLTANGASPSPWGNIPKFGLNWTNPYDRSGIVRARYKLGSVPTANDDTTGTISGTPPDSAVATAAGGQPLYLWLVDGSGNTSYQNRATVQLRYDPFPPSGSTASSPAFSASASFAVSWSAGSDTGGSGLSGRYAVRVRDGAGPWIPWLADTQALSAAYPGLDGHRYFFEAAAWDSAGNCEVFLSAAECSTVVNTSLPAVASMSLAPDTVLLPGFTVLAARLTDNQKLMAAEFFIDAVGAAGSGLPATPVDSFGQASVDVRDSIFTAALSVGTHWVFLHGRDDAGQWGPFDSASFHKPVPDTVRPSFTIQIAPPAPTIGLAVAVTAVPSEPLHPDSSVSCTLRAADGSLLPLTLAMDSASLRASLSTAGLPAGACRLTVAGYDRWSNRGSSYIDFTLSASGDFLPEDMVYVWPNPARGSQVHFHYYVNANASVTAEVFSLDGHRVAKLAGKGQGGRPPHQAGSNALVWDIAGAASDVYLLRLTATPEAGGESRTVVKRFAIVR
jgi:hypothetical protein